MRYDFEDIIFFGLVVGNDNLSCYKWTINKNDNHKWITTMSEDMESLGKNKI